MACPFRLFFFPANALVRRKRPRRLLSKLWFGRKSYKRFFSMHSLSGRLTRRLGGGSGSSIRKKFSAFQTRRSTLQMTHSNCHSISRKPINGLTRSSAHSAPVAISIPFPFPA